MGDRMSAGQQQQHHRRTRSMYGLLEEIAWNLLHNSCTVDLP